jgi:hypothetical protein
MPRTATALKPATSGQTVINVGTVTTPAKPARAARTKQPSARPDLSVVKPPATPAKSETPVVSKADAAKIATLEKRAASQISTGMVKATELADTLVNLYRLNAWFANLANADGKTPGQRRANAVRAYFEAMGISEDNYSMPAAALTHLLKVMFGPDAPEGATNADVAAMSGAGLRSVVRLKGKLGLANENRVNGQPTTGQTSDGDANGDNLTVGTGSVDSKPTERQISALIEKLNAVAPYLTDDQRKAIKTLMDISGE